MKNTKDLKSVLFKRIKQEKLLETINFQFLQNQNKLGIKNVKTKTLALYYVNFLAFNDKMSHPSLFEKFINDNI